MTPRSSLVHVIFLFFFFSKFSAKSKDAVENEFGVISYLMLGGKKIIFKIVKMRVFFKKILIKENAESTNFSSCPLNG